MERGLQLKGRRVVITGSSRGIGLSICKLFSQNGAKIVANARNKNKLQEVTSKVSNCHTIAGDVTSYEFANKLILKAFKHMGGIDILVCNVGSGTSVPPGQENIDEWHKMFATNFFSALNVIEAAKPILESGSSIICISSICGNETIPGAPICYSTAKSALNSYVNSISRYFGKNGIRINAISPGNVLFPGSVWDSKMKANSEQTKKLIDSEVPLADFARTQDIAEAALWLATEKSKFVTGSLLTVDGGQTRSI